MLGRHFKCFLINKLKNEPSFRVSKIVMPICHAHPIILYLRKTIQYQICSLLSQDQRDMQPRFQARWADEAPRRRRSQTEVGNSSRDADALSQFRSCSFHGLNLQARYVTFSYNKAVPKQDQTKIRGDETGLNWTNPDTAEISTNQN